MAVIHDTAQLAWMDSKQLDEEKYNCVDDQSVRGVACFRDSR